VEQCCHYKAVIPLENLPFVGCRYCTRVRSQWQTFEDDINYVVPLAVRSININIEISGLPNGYSNEELKEIQRQDKDLSTVISWFSLAYEPSRQELQMTSPAIRYLWQCKSQLQLTHNILLYTWESQIGMKQVFISPSCMKDQILKYCHDIRSSGHLGQDKTLSKLKKVAHWHGMSTDCKLYVKTCHICNRQKKVNKKEKADLGQHHSGVPFERIHMDILGPLPVSKLGNKYILVIIDQFTKWIECYPLPNQYTETIAKALMDSTISRFGCPLEIHTDQGKYVDGNLIRHLCDRLEISKTRTTAYIPASNGQVERYNRLLTHMIRCYIKKNLHNWDAYLQQLTGAIRSTENRQAGFTPNVMLFGRENVHPNDLVLGLNMADKGEISEYVKNLRDTLVEVHSLSRTNIKRAQMKEEKL
jgi:hypothetical protein